MRKRPVLLWACGCAVAALAVAIWYIRRDAAEDLGDIRAAGRAPQISPDYAGVVIPPNIAPLNFVVKEPGARYCVRFSGDAGAAFDVFSASGGVVIPMAKWKALLEANRGGAVSFRVCVKGRDGLWRGFEPIVNRVAREPLDPFLVYRLVHTFNKAWADLSLHQRNLETFDDETLMHSASIDGCMNCHTFCAGRTSPMVLHVRAAEAGPRGGMLLLRSGGVTKVDTSTAFNPTQAKYISLHPGGRLAAFSAVDLTEFYHVTGDRGELFERKGDMLLYLFDTNTVTTTLDICRPDREETYPSWSPDGQYLYYCSGPSLPLDRYKEIRYDLMRIRYDATSGAWGRPETVLSAADAGLSVLFPRLSPDGRFLLFTMCSYGPFAVGQASADLYLMDVATRAYRRIDINSDQGDTWHSWSSNGRWIVFTSRRRDGVMGRPYFSYFDETGRFSKPLILPQEDPAFYDSFLQTYNLPELVAEPVPLTPREFVEAAWSTRTLKAVLDPKVTPRPAAEPAPKAAPQSKVGSME